MSSRNIRSMIVLALIILLLLIFQTPLMRAYRDRVWQGWVTIVGDWFSVGSLAIDNSVDQQVNRLVAENWRLQAEIKDLQAVRSQVGSVGFTDYVNIPVRIAPSPLDPWQVKYLVNKGAADGVQLGAPVIIDGPILIGLVSELQEYAAVIQLLYHPESSLPAEVVVNDVTAKGLVTGNAYTGVQITKIPRDVQLTAGLAVVTAEITDKMPGGMLIGTMENIANEEHDPYQQSKIRVPYKVRDLRAAVILISP